MPDEIVLANEILMRRHDALVFDGGERDDLASRIRDALSQVRELEPDLVWLRPVPEFDPRRVIVGLSAQSMDAVVDATNGREYAGPIETGLSGLDRLDSKLGLRGIWWSRVGPGGDGFVSLCLNERVNMRVAAERYTKQSEAKYAETSGLISIGPYPDLSVVEERGMLYIVARQRTGLCFAGCTDFDMYYFRFVPNEPGVGGSIERFDEAEALADGRFQAALELIG